MANSGDASDTSTVLQSFLNRISSWFRSFSHCFGDCFGGSATDDDQLLRDGPSHSNSAEPFPHRVSYLAKGKAVKKIPTMVWSFIDQFTTVK